MWPLNHPKYPNNWFVQKTTVVIVILNLWIFRHISFLLAKCPLECWTPFIIICRFQQHTTSIFLIELSLFINFWNHAHYTSLLRNFEYFTVYSWSTISNIFIQERFNNEYNQLGIAQKLSLISCVVCYMYAHEMKICTPNYVYFSRVCPHPFTSSRVLE